MLPRTVFAKGLALAVAVAFLTFPVTAETKACVPGNVNPMFKDYDKDGVYGLYARSDSNTIATVGVGTVKTEAGPSHCWLAGDPNDDGTSHVPEAVQPQVACVAGAANPFVRDFDSDGQPAVYVRSSSNLRVTLAQDGTLAVTPGPVYCWQAGDVDDDGSHQLPWAPPTVGPEVKTCIPGAPNVLWKDFDHDGQLAVYARNAANAWFTIHGDGSTTYSAGPTDCWLAGDWDDDGGERLNADRPGAVDGATPDANACTPGEATQPVVRDLDFDGEAAIYLRTGVTEAFLEPGFGVMLEDGGMCWIGGDLDDDRTNRGQAIYAYGDSITAALTSGLTPDGSDAYVFSARDGLDPSASAGHSLDGSGRSSWWGAAALDRHLPTSGRNHLFIIEFGLNDRRSQCGNLSVEQTVENLQRIYEAALPYADHVMVALPLLFDPSQGGWSSPLAEQHAWIGEIESQLAASGIPAFKTYDSLDTVPGNGVPDAWDGTYILDHVHPDAAGHDLIGADLAAFIVAQGWTDLAAPEASGPLPPVNEAGMVPG